MHSRCRFMVVSLVTWTTLKHFQIDDSVCPIQIVGVVIRGTYPRLHLGRTTEAQSDCRPCFVVRSAFQLGGSKGVEGNYMRLRVFLSTVFIAASLFAFSATTAQAQSAPHAEAAHTAKSCAAWNVAGKWLSVASNNYDTTFIISQHGTHLSGRASIPASEAANSGYSTGTFTGTMIGQRFSITVIWAPRASDGVRLHGRYTGTVISRHIVKGLALDLTTKPTPAPASWVGYGPTRCTKS
jgi:hypothetical protein